MNQVKWKEEIIQKHHDRNGFDCGEPALNEYLSKHARRNHERGGAKTYVAVNGQTILGYYTLSPASLSYEQTPAVIKKGLARYDVPVFRLARLAVDQTCQGQGLGGQLLLLAGKRCLCVASQVGGVAMLIDAKHERAAQWYQSYGAVPIIEQPLSLLISFKTIHAALKAANKL